jgi:hypothetical protein
MQARQGDMSEAFADSCPVVETSRLRPVIPVAVRHQGGVGQEDLADVSLLLPSCVCNGFQTALIECQQTCKQRRLVFAGRSGAAGTSLIQSFPVCW